jgi:hypothetical protein
MCLKYKGVSLHVLDLYAHDFLVGVRVITTFQCQFLVNKQCFSGMLWTATCTVRSWTQPFGVLFLSMMHLEETKKPQDRLEGMTTQTRGSNDHIKKGRYSRRHMSCRQSAHLAHVRDVKKQGPITFQSTQH